MIIPALLRNRLENVLCSSVAGRLIAFLTGDRINYLGSVIDTSSPGVAPSIKAGLFWRFYESAEVGFVRRYLRKDLDVVELGSGIGVVASHIARRLDPSGRLFCVEANSALLDRVVTNVRSNAPLVRLVVIHGAINYSRDVRTMAQLMVPSDSREAMVVKKMMRRDAKTGFTVSAPSMSLAEILFENGIRDYSMIADIEGAEAGMILREKKSLARCRQLIIELHQAIYNGRRYTVTSMIHALKRTHKFRLRDQNRSVFIFER